ncbi:cupin domain-containing protein [Psychrobacter sp. SWN149]|uniref:cupin domain-containing protein n=1 Tax=Psychrobacter sp. SWN149 TaxID=2792057 RepID=UPI001D124930
MVIEGRIIIRIEYSTYLLNQGDSYVIDTIQPHTFINLTDSITRIVSAHTDDLLNLSLALECGYIKVLNR